MRAIVCLARSNAEKAIRRSVPDGFFLPVLGRKDEDDMSILPSAGLRARVALDKHGFSTAHSLGQNFLLDDNLLSHLLDETGVTAQDNVLEIGPGAGVMTALLAQRAKRVLAVEVDERLRPVLDDVLAPCENAAVEYCDFLKFDMTKMLDGFFEGEPFCVVANLPYYITAEILMKLTTAGRRPASISIMVQKEAAERLMSEPGCKQWCALAATVRSYGMAKVVAEVPSDAFHPAPHVDSCFLRIDAYAQPAVEPEDGELYLKIIQSAFAMRRKTMLNNLKAAFHISQEDAKTVLEQAGVPERARGESLSLSELSAISDGLRRILG